MLTLFTTAKAIKGYFGMIQQNAIRSWTRLRPECEIIIFGDDEGVKEISAELSIQNIADIDRTEQGMPLLSAMFEVAQDCAKHDLICFINADIILLNDFMKAAQRVWQLQKSQFVMVGRRWDVDVNYLIDFNDDKWEEQLREAVRHSRLHSSKGMDYFVFPRGTYRDIPAFAVARTGFDNWLVYRARAMDVPVIDITSATTVIHQNHDYSHYPGGAEAILATPDVARNRELMGEEGHAFSVYHATLILDKSGLKRPLSPMYLYKNCTAKLVLNPKLKFFHICYKGLLRVVFRVSSITSISRLARKFINTE